MHLGRSEGSKAERKEGKREEKGKERKGERKKSLLQKTQTWNLGNRVAGIRNGDGEDWLDKCFCCMGFIRAPELLFWGDESSGKQLPTA